jgi:hypothetical protein
LKEESVIKKHSIIQSTKAILQDNKYIAAFGEAPDLKITDNCDKDFSSSARLGSVYETFQDGFDLTGGSKKFQVSEIEVFAVTSEQIRESVEWTRDELAECYTRPACATKFSPMTDALQGLDKFSKQTLDYSAVLHDKLTDLEKRENDLKSEIEFMTVFQSNFFCESKGSVLHFKINNTRHSVSSGSLSIVKDTYLRTRCCSGRWSNEEDSIDDQGNIMLRIDDVYDLDEGPFRLIVSRLRLLNLAQSFFFSSNQHFIMDGAIYQRECMGIFRLIDGREFSGRPCYERLDGKYVFFFTGKLWLLSKGDKLGDDKGFVTCTSDMIVPGLCSQTCKWREWDDTAWVDCGSLHLSICLSSAWQCEYLETSLVNRFDTVRDFLQFEPDFFSWIDTQIDEVGVFAATISSWVGVNMSNWSLLFRGTRDGFTSADFHRLCDGKGSTIIFIRDRFRSVFGGFAEKPWSSPSRNQTEVASTASFLFSLSVRGSMDSKSIRLCPVIQSSGALVHSASLLAAFGADLQIVNECHQKHSRTNLGTDYESHGCKFLLTGGSEVFQVAEIEVFQVPAIKP